jgi:hypothetical protein
VGKLILIAIKLITTAYQAMKRFLFMPLKQVDPNRVVSALESGSAEILVVDTG